jgi:hypothetical protein
LRNKKKNDNLRQIIIDETIKLAATKSIELNSMQSEQSHHGLPSQESVQYFDLSTQLRTTSVQNSSIDLAATEIAAKIPLQCLH